MRSAYIFDEQDRLTGIIDDVSHYTNADIEKLEQATLAVGRHVAITDRGRGVCAGCHLDLGEREIAPGLFSHGLCKNCLT